VTHVLHRSLRADPELALRASGNTLHLSDGREVIDASGGAAVACIGHANERVVAAIAAQARRLDYVHTTFVTSEAAEALADLLLGDEPGGLSHAFFVSSGSEAMESALKMARQYHVERGEPRRTHFISRRQSYHGNTFGAMAASGHPARRAPYEAILPPGFSHVSPCFAYHEQAAHESEADYVARLASELEAEFQRVGPDRVIAFIAETVVGATTGCVPPVPGYFAAVRSVCERHGALLILDEVMCGMGRTGTTHAWEQEDVTPDLQAVAKGLGGGYQPIGALLVSRRIIQALLAGSGAFVHGHTYQAHPVACAAALEVQRIIRDDGLLENVRAMGSYLEAALIERFGNHAHVGDIRGRGLFWGLEFVADRDSKRPFDAVVGLGSTLKTTGLAHGLAVYPSSGTVDGHNGDHLIVAPPYTVDRGGIDKIVGRLGATVDAALVSCH
jgi:adenosylmethionine-8-amino-7-oxononanoate aminotransferase